MTLEDVGKIYLARKSEIDDVSNLIRLLTLTLNADRKSPNSIDFTTCSVRIDILEHATEHLKNYLNRLKHSMEDEVT